MKCIKTYGKRVEIISKYLAGLINCYDAAIAMGVKERQFRRIKKRFLEIGIDSIQHGNVGRSPANKISQELESKILRFYRNHTKKIPNVPYFREKLLASSAFDYVPCETVLRRILKENKLCRTYRRRNKRSHKFRNSYDREGIMVQLDGSYHKWFGNKVTCLILTIDDATSKILAAKFCKSETTIDTMDVLGDVIKTHGRFQFLYTDRAGVYTSSKREGYCHVEEAMRDLDIIPLQASTPQAKGRIERQFRTLQDWLTADLAWANIYTIEEANKFLKNVFIRKFNKKFAVEPRVNEPAYRPVDKDLNLDEILCRREIRKIGSGDVFSFNNQRFLIVGNYSYSLKGHLIEVKIYKDGHKRFYLKGKEVHCEKLYRRHKAA